MIVAICGAGNAGHALAVAASENTDCGIVWLTGSEEKAAALRAGVFSRDGLTSTGAIVGRASNVTAISSNAAEIIPDADLVVIAVPAFGHASVMRRIAPYLKPSAVVGATPARGGFEFEATAMLCAAGQRRTIFGLQTLPWSTRVQQTAKTCNFGAIKAQVLMAALPQEASDSVALVLSQIFGTKIVPTTNFLNMTLGNPGQVIHPGLMYTLFSGKGSCERFGADAIPYFYRNTTDQAGAFIEQLSADVCAVARAIERDCNGALDLCGVWPVLEWLRHTYPTQTQDTLTAATCFRTGPFRERKVPAKPLDAGMFAPDFQYRYMTEDVPFGLVVTKGFAQLAGVGTPAIDAVLRWAQRKLHASYIRNAELDMAGVYALPVPQNYGFESLDALVRWYAGGSTLSRTSARLTA
jgi:opine dehydrogenase